MTIQRTVGIAVGILSIVTSSVNTIHGILNQKPAVYYVLYVGLIVVFSIPIWLSIVVEAKAMKVMQVITVGGMSYLSCYISPHNPFALLGLVLMLLMIYRYEFTTKLNQIVMLCVGVYCLIVMFRVASIELAIKYVTDYVIMAIVYRALLWNLIDTYLNKKLESKEQRILKLRERLEEYRKNQERISVLLHELKERMLQDKKIFISSLGGFGD